jgi:hypothetical protein
MPEIGTSGSMSGDGKRGVGQSAPSHRTDPRLYFPGCGHQDVDMMGEPVEQRTRKPLGTEYAGPFVKRQV